MTSTQYKVQISNVSKIFGPKPLAALDLIKAGLGKDEILEKTGHIVGVRDVSLDILPGEIFVIMGLSGSGKSTLIRHVNRLIDPTSGTILVDGVDVTGMSDEELREFRRHKLSMVFQRFGLLPHRQVLANVAYGLTVQGVERRKREQIANHWIEQVGLSGFENCFPRELSGGMQQRVGLARALATDPEILLMDEAFSALDPLIRNDMQQQLLTLQKLLHKTILFITHDLEEALRLGDRIAILKDGEVKQVGTPEQILVNPAGEYVERFVRDVNRGRVLTAGSLMARAAVMTMSEMTSKPLQANSGGRSSDHIYIVDDDGGFLGVFDDNKTGQKLTEDFVRCALYQVPCINHNTVIEEVAMITLNCAAPVPVVGEDGKIKGVLSQSAAVAALTRN